MFRPSAKRSTLSPHSGLARVDDAECRVRRAVRSCLVDRACARSALGRPGYCRAGAQGARAGVGRVGLAEAVVGQAAGRVRGDHAERDGWVVGPGGATVDRQADRRSGLVHLEGSGRRTRVAQCVRSAARNDVGAIADQLGTPFTLLKEVQRINEGQKARFLKAIRETLWVLREKRIAVWGLTFKPDTDDIRSSVAIELVEQLLRERAHVIVYDPKGMQKARGIKAIADAEFASSALEAVTDAEALIIATDWNEFCNVDFAMLKEKMQTPIVFDGRNLLDPETMRQFGFHYYSIGRASVKPQ